MLTTSAQKYIGSLVSLSIVLAASTKVQYFLSTTPFCCGVLGADYLPRYSLFSAKVIHNSILEFCSFDWPYHRTCKFVSNSIFFMWSKNICGASYFECRNITQVYFQWSSTITKAFWFLDMDMTFTGPVNLYESVAVVQKF